VRQVSRTIEKRHVNPGGINAAAVFRGAGFPNPPFQPAADSGNPHLTDSNGAVA